MDGLARHEWYLMTSNHQSWADILVLQKVTNRRVPSLKFFLKQELIWVPLLGLAWWALDFPFMKRYSRAQLEKRPELKGKDMETTRKACEKYAHYPVSVMNFFEGTRFTEEKHRQQNSPYRHCSNLGRRRRHPQGHGRPAALPARLHHRLPAGHQRSLLGFLGGDMDRVEVIARRRRSRTGPPRAITRTTRSSGAAFRSG